MQDLQTASPAEIDAEIATLASKLASAEAQVSRWSDAAARHPERYGETLGRYEDEALKLREQLAPFEAEYRRRGGWERSYRAANTDGHYHRSMNCPTCNNGRHLTTFAWMTQLSGMSEAEIIAAAGMDACTVCYPSAPVDPKERKRVKTAEAAARREARAAEKLAKEIAKGDRAMGLALKVDELLGFYGSHREMADDYYVGEKSRGSWEKGGRFGKGYETAYYVAADVWDRRERAAARAAA